jgi:hypothetical protein
MWHLNELIGVDFHGLIPMEKTSFFCCAMVGKGLLMGQTQCEQHSNWLEHY